MSHVYRCQIRWGDLDALNHVNNATYVDYCREAANDFFAGLGVAQPPEVLRQQVRFVAPLLFGADPVEIHTVVTAATPEVVHLHQIVQASTELHGSSPHGQGSGPTVYARVDSVVSPIKVGIPVGARHNAAGAELLSPRRAVVGVSGVARIALQVRASDADASGQLSPMQHLVLFQEARLALLSRGSQAPLSVKLDIVMARADVDYRSPVVPGSGQFYVDTWVGHIGTTSFVVEGQLGVRPVNDLAGEERREARLLSTSAVVIVRFDPETGRPVPLADAVKDTLRSLQGNGGA